MSKLIATSQMTLVNLAEKAIDRTEVTFWHGLSATKHPLGVYDCGGRDHAFANEFDVVSGKKYTVRIIAQKTKGTINLKGGIWYTERTSGHQFDGLAALTQAGELSEDGLGIWERTLTVPNGKTKGRVYVQLEQSSTSGFSTAYRVYDAQVFDENGQPLVTDQNNFGALTSPMAAPDGTYIWKRTITYYTDGTNDIVWEYSGVGAKGVEVGGRNLYIISKASKGFISMNSESLGGQNSTNKEYTSDFIPVTAGEQFVFQGWVTIAEGGGSWRAWQFYGEDKKKIGDRPTNGGQATVGLQHYTHNITVPNNTSIKYIRVSARLYEDGKLKLERGNVATDYSLAPEDVQSDIDSKADQALTQQQLNALAEKEALVRAEMEAKASIDQLDKWTSSYQAYVESNDQDKKEAEQQLIDNTKRIVAMSQDWEDKKVHWSFLDTYMDYSDDGLSIGKRGNSTSLRIDNDRISFYSGGKEVAYFSQGTLQIDNGVFTKTLQIGRYREEQYSGDATINVTHYLDFA
ncbi:hypothetical protein GPZ88_01050 [Streptococcus ruminicola]|uniref:Antireceptor n=1 Tax=Streptococcus ruminicola TaxID=2686210 RepID=A0A6G8HXU9_9STRE|nr:hypothetical protein [Streptococcus ruminicola]QIM45727.1 hypothetical protein GPZ88_01050 [Streptococcus ruminicola]